MVRVRLGHPMYPDCEFDVEALVDTGFSGGLAVPESFIPARVHPHLQAKCELADGSILTTDAYRAEVTIGLLPPIPTSVIVLPHQALLGRAVTNHFRLSFLYGREVILER